MKYIVTVVSYVESEIHKATTALDSIEHLSKSSWLLMISVHANLRHPCHNKFMRMVRAIPEGETVSFAVEHHNDCPEMDFTIEVMAYMEEIGKPIEYPGIVPVPEQE